MQTRYIVFAVAPSESPAKADSGPLASMAAPALSSLTVLQPVHSTTIPGYASFAQYAAPSPIKPQPLLSLEDANHNTQPQEQCPDGEIRSLFVQSFLALLLLLLLLLLLPVATLVAVWIVDTDDGLFW